MVDIQDLPSLCRTHLHQASDIYRGGGSDRDKQSALDALMSQTESCDRCQRLNRGETGPAIMNPHVVPSWEGAKLVESWPYETVEFFVSKRNRRDELERRKLFPPSRLSEPLKRKLHQIVPSEDNAYPASVRLIDGFKLPRVIFIDEEYVLKWHLGFWTGFVGADKVVDVSDSPFKMPPPVLRKLASEGETSMNSLEFRITLKDGKRLPCWYSGYNPFIELPQPYEPASIVDVEVGRGLVVLEAAVLADPDFVWCVYQ